ncbi:MAG: hypothetical protein GY757_42100, partial [bacterium]|nr:hypothetical protein [bacterium]
KWLFKLCEDTTADEAPRTACRIMSLLTREQQAALVFHLFEKWFDNKGNAAHEWAVLLIREYGDDRLAPLFLKAVKHWNKKSKPKTQKVIGWMGKLGSVYALSEVKNIYEGRFSESIIYKAKTVLTEVAKERGQSLPELFEELTPTLDYTNEGLVLDAGPRKYMARIQSDGNLIIVHENGKTTKSFPKQKKDEDPDIYKASKSKL